MKTLAATLILSLAALAAGGCASPLKERFDATAREIHAARAAGAHRYAPADYQGAIAALDLARLAEADALDQRSDAEEQAEEAKREIAKLGEFQGQREEALQDAERRRIGADGQLAALHRRAAELKARGVSDREIERSLGDEMALAQLEASMARASLKTIRAELEMLNQRKQLSQAKIATAQEGVAAAGQQLLHASALCDTAGAEARMAEAHAIARRKAELQVR